MQVKLAKYLSIYLGAMVIIALIAHYHWTNVILAYYGEFNKSYSTGLINRGLFYYSATLFIGLTGLTFLIGARSFKQVKKAKQVKTIIKKGGGSIQSAFLKGTGLQIVVDGINSLRGSKKKSKSISQSRPADVHFYRLGMLLLIGTIVILDLIIQFYAVKTYYRDGNHFWGVYAWDVSLVGLACLITGVSGFLGYKVKIGRPPSGVILK